MIARRGSGERGIALILALIMLMLMVGLIASYLAVSTSNLKLTASSHSSLQALYVAETGLAQALHELNGFNLAAFRDENGNPAPAKGPYGSPYTLRGAYSVKSADNQDVVIGTYRVRLDVTATDPASNNAPSFIRLASQGEYNGVRRIVEASVQYSPDPRVNHAIIVDGNLSIGGNLTVRGDVHTNGTLTLAQSSSVDILPADPTLSDLGSPPYSGAFAGNLTACQGAVPMQCNVAGCLDTAAPQVAVPQIAPDVLSAKAEELGWQVEKRSPGGPQCTQKWRGTPPDDSDLACPDGYPGKLILVNGNVELRGQVRGNVVIVATGNIEITGSVSVAGAEGEGSQTIILALGNVAIRGNSTVNAMVVADGDICAMGNATVNGSIVGSNEVAGSTDVFTGNLTVNYVRACNAVETLMKRWRLVSWRQVAAGGREGGRPVQ